jgi:hypothetical protein
LDLDEELFATPFASFAALDISFKSAAVLDERLFDIDAS